ncbi:fumarylacetoacetate hydrolase family protein [Streptacidiphilus sp. MAP5-3]|uniref:fumarylacetoacetate hydrolase family protein n=1 Tax=unclassified Streptacidiphilus TaxID=2643834 RepID=UPI003512F2AA
MASDWESLPGRPGKIVVIGRNYGDRDDVAAAGAAPLAVFFKPPTAVIGSGDAVRLPAATGEVRFEGELAVVIGRRCKDVPAEAYRDVVYGYTCADDVTAWDVGTASGHWSRAKSYDTFCPLGPRIVRDLDPTDLAVRTRVNGELRQDGTTARLLRPVPQLVAEVSRLMTLEPGDVLLTGTPGGGGPLRVGDHVEVEIAGIGTLTHTVAEAGDAVDPGTTALPPLA